MNIEEPLSFNKFIHKIEANALLVRKKKWKVICLLTDFDGFSDLIESLKSNKFTTTPHGEVFKITKHIDNGTDNFVAFIAQNGDLIYFFSNENKEDIEKYFVKKYLNKVKHVYYLWIPKVIIEETVEQFQEIYNNALFITEFHAERDLLDNTDSYFRKNFKRKLTYYGKDGLDAIKEFRYYYGVRPYLVEFNILNNCYFRINNDGFFIYNDGDLNFLISVIEETYEKIKTLVNLTKSSISEEILIKELEQYTINTQPLIIKFQNYKLGIENIEDFLENLRPFGFEAYNESVIEGSIIFNACIIDTNKKATFNLSAGDKELVITPQFDTTFDTFFRFIEVLSENLDSELEYKPYTHSKIMA